MGWCRGSEIAEDVWKLMRPFVYVKERKRIARKLIDIFENHDADTMEEAEQLWQDADITPEPE
jgi:hypothetical protein